MKQAPLQLERYYFTKVAIESHLGVDGNEPNLLGCEIGIGQSDDNPKRFKVSLRVVLTSQPGKQACYTGEIRADGFFQVHSEWPVEKIQQLVESNGVAMLYGAIREMVFNVTAHGPWLPVHLMAVTFADPNNKVETAQSST